MCLYTAIVLVTPLSVVAEILLGAAHLGLTDGQRAFIHLDTRSALNASSQLAMTIPLSSLPTAGNSSNADADLVMKAAQSLLIVKAHSMSLANVSATSSFKV